jgi:hypothetical protein
MRQSRRWCFRSEQLIDSLRSQVSDPHHMGLVIMRFSVNPPFASTRLSKARSPQMFQQSNPPNLNSSSISRRLRLSGSTRTPTVLAPADEVIE